MSHTLRARVIRLAHERPDLRPHLLPLLAEHHKEAWGLAPRDAISFGYVGYGADEAGKSMASVVAEAKQQTRVQADKLWRQLAAEIISNESVDDQPDLSRRVVALSLRDVYQDLYEKVQAYFKSVP